MKLKKWLCINILFMLILINVNPVSFYVSDAGSDTNPGTPGSIFRTFSGARTKVREYIANNGMSEDIRVIFSAGTYYNAGTVVFSEADSGINGYRVIYGSGETNPNNKVIIAGGSRITGWVSYNGSIYRKNIPLSKPRDLFENRRKGIEVSNLMGLTTPEILLQVNMPGEYYYDEGTQDLYYYPGNSVIANQEIFIPGADNIIALQGASDNFRVENISFINLVIMGSREKASGLTNFDEESGLIYMENARSIIIESCELLYAGVSGIVANKYAQNIIIRDSRVDNFNLNGISLRGYMPGTGGYADPDDADVNHNNIVQNNFIVNGSYKSDSGSGIRIIQSGNNSIVNNRIRSISGNGIMIHGPDNDILGSTYYGIIVTWGNKWSFIHARNNSLRRNEISRITPKSTGGGGIYLAQHGPGTTIENNCIHDFSIESSGAKPSGIYIGSLSENAAIRSNIIYNIDSAGGLGRPMHISGNNSTIEKNVFSGYGANSGMGFYSTDNNAQNLTIRNNVFYRDKGQYIYNFDEFDNPDFNGCNNNLFYHADGMYQVKTPGDIYDFIAWQKLGGSGYDKQSDTALNPLFEEPESHYYDVKSGSPALSNGFSNINQEEIGLDPGFKYQYAGDLIEAEKCLSPSNILDRVTTIRSASPGGRARYPSIYFEDTLTNVELKYSCNAPSESATGRQIEIRLDSIGGALLKTIDITGTGDLSTYRIHRTGITGVSGVHDVFIVFTGSSPGIQLDWFHFYDVVIEPVPSSNLAPDVTII
ncbi:MAG: carbohydrate-binding protein, partial [Spirochaetales bacterium]|nr:carbohydrate-binding protein [Spirochaetales bacterium]